MGVDVVDVLGDGSVNDCIEGVSCSLRDEFSNTVVTGMLDCGDNRDSDQNTGMLVGCLWEDDDRVLWINGIDVNECCDWMSIWDGG